MVAAPSEMLELQSGDATSAGLGNRQVAVACHLGSVDSVQTESGVFGLVDL
jgi:hypothetical protein